MVSSRGRNYSAIRQVCATVTCNVDPALSKALEGFRFAKQQGSLSAFFGTYASNRPKPTQDNLAQLQPLGYTLDLSRLLRHADRNPPIFWDPLAKIDRKQLLVVEDEVHKDTTLEDLTEELPDDAPR
ncbi:hypothetical protein IWQ60_003546 [Tieghemiomyces parasiticus]|uniref:Uncharacterized protein n=1 Tax=Tieghemiomyces parasiticus TaxID=78921 RepID=A0A9W8AFZ2_9FUNG|nr:hypothetical protein IWQ60_003546 [Tieghemiomyces parasiticus]